MKKFFTFFVSVVVAMAANASTLVGSYTATAVTGYDYPCANTTLDEYDDCIIIKAFDSTEGNDLKFEWDNTGWTACNGAAEYTVTIHNNANYTKAVISANSVGYTTSSYFYVKIIAYKNDADTEGTSTYLYWTLKKEQTEFVTVKSYKATYTDYSSSYPTYTSETLAKGFETTVNVNAEGEYQIKNWLQTGDHDLVLTPTSTGSFDMVNGSKAGSNSYVYVDGIYIYLGNNSWWTKDWIYLSVYADGDYRTMYFNLSDETTGIAPVKPDFKSAHKFFENGKLVIEKNGVKYNASGIALKH